MNILPCTIQERDDGLFARVDGSDGRVWFRSPAGNRRRIELGLRPDHLTILRAGEIPSPGPVTLLSEAAPVIRLEYLGHESVATLAVGPLRLTARCPASSEIRAGRRWRSGS